MFSGNQLTEPFKASDGLSQREKTVISLCKMSPRGSAEVVSSIPKHKRGCNMLSRENVCVR